MSKDQFLGIVRHLLTAAGGIITTLGFASDSLVSSVTGALLGAAATGWSVWAKRSGK